MKYKKCPRCGLNYIKIDEEICCVCRNEQQGKKSIFDELNDEFLCPYCEKNNMGIDDVMCSQCRKKRNGKKQ
ncbi:putative uncharacterized protein [Corallococcus sp. CAG:1435]|uniref:Uncharacterized protein n=1 Tax=Candidatus Fimimonas gallinarum TaxID=2840821 RepID=A0A9D1J851_9BACT|nr:putative uncharacterized protein [Corallococcus sp. CAG:1435]HIR66053.1 hypothetical protein [Candidatus Fimimonas gallinarum]